MSDDDALWRAIRAINDRFEPFLKRDRGGSTVGPAFSAHKNGTNQTIAANTLVKITFGTELFDTQSCFDNVTNYRFTPNVAGKYLLHGCIFFSSVADQVQIGIEIYKNGTTAAKEYTNASSASGESVSVTTELDANGTTDYFEVYGFQFAGATPTANGGATITYFTGALVG